MSGFSDKDHLVAVGARIFSEANDLKRTVEALAREIGFDLDTVRAVVEGRAEAGTAESVVRAMADTYPVSLSDLWVEPDDTDAGVKIMRAEDSAATARVFERKDRSGGFSPYYEYRDTAMSRTAPFKPEWISELRVVDDADPDNPDVAYNHGHLMHQCTFFIGEVNFYWRIGDRSYSAEMNTGDSNYITPFVPHSFASRDPNRLGLILAVTYGGMVQRALNDFGRIGDEAANVLAGDSGDMGGAFRARIDRCLSTESLTASELIDRLERTGMARRRATEVLEGVGQPSMEELTTLAATLHVRLEDVTVTPAPAEDKVSVCFAHETEIRAFPNGNQPTYRLKELARNPRQPGLKGFEVTVLGGVEPDPEGFRHGLHEYVYNYGDEPVEILWGNERRDVMNPGDSAYVRPMVPHAFAAPVSDDGGHLVVIRVPGLLNDAVIEEFAAYPPEGRARVAREIVQWF